MKVYSYDDEGFYVGEYQAQPNPKRKGEFLIPANAAAEAPPNPGKDEIPKYKDGSWILVPDHSGKPFYNKQSQEEKFYKPGETPETEYTDIAPEGDVNEFVDGKWRLSENSLKQREKSEAEQYLKDTDWYIIRLNDPDRKKPIPEEVKSKRAEAIAKLNQLKDEGY